jgi:glutamate 5-kinase
MKTKLMAAKTAVAGGCAMAIMEGSTLRPLTALAEGAPAPGSAARRPAGRAQALDRRDEAQGRGDGGRGRRRGAEGRASRCCPRACARSRAASGAASRWRSCRPAGEVLGKGLCATPPTRPGKIAGHRSGEIEAILGYPGRAALIHRDDMVV